MIEAAALLEEIADEFESGEMAWCQGQQSKPDLRPERGYSYCIVGAIDHKLGQFLISGNAWFPAMQRVQDYAIRAIAQNVDPASSPTAPFNAVTRWNDRPERTLSEVVDALKHAAKDLHNAA